MYVICVHRRDTVPEAHAGCDFSKLLYPGSIVRFSELVERGVTLSALQDIHLQALVMCVRGDNFEKLSVKLMRALDPGYDFLAVLFGPWAQQLTPPICKHIGLNAQALLDAGIHRHNVRELFWPLSRWVDLFGVDESFMAALNIQDLDDYFPNLHSDIRGMGGAGARTRPSRKDAALFKIEL